MHPSTWNDKNLNTRSSRGAVAYISHGGGPLPLLGDGGHEHLVENLVTLAELVPEPAAIVVVSAHWEATRATLTSAANPSLIYDYSGFPPESYRISYPAPGHPALARRIFKRLGDCGIAAAVDENRGFDHGLFVPLKLMYPAAGLPCVQLSLLAGLEPGAHLAVGEALAGLANEGILLLGSGFSFHNLPAFFHPPSAGEQSLNGAFDQWLVDTCSAADLAEPERRRRLLNWEAAPGARYCHPREEHLLPLHVCYGAAQSAARRVFRFPVMGRQACAFLW